MFSGIDVYKTTGLMGKATLSSWVLRSEENEVFSMRKRGQHDALVFLIGRIADLVVWSAV